MPAIRQARAGQARALSRRQGQPGADHLHDLHRPAEEVGNHRLEPRSRAWPLREQPAIVQQDLVRNVEPAGKPCGAEADDGSKRPGRRVRLTRRCRLEEPRRPVLGRRTEVEREPAMDEEVEEGRQRLVPRARGEERDLAVVAGQDPARPDEAEEGEHKAWRAPLRLRLERGDFRCRKGKRQG